MTLPAMIHAHARFCAVVVLLLTAAPGFALDMTVALNKSVYAPGEPMEITVTAYNPGPTELQLSFPTSCQMYYQMDGFEAPGVCLQVLTDARVPAYGSRNWQMQHSWSAYNPGPGVHSLTAGLLGYGAAGTVYFEVAIPAAQLELSLSLDKTRYQIGERMEISLTARNLSPTDITLHFSSSCQMYYALGAYHPPQACWDILTQVTIPGSGSYTWRMPHSWSKFNPGAGTHIISGGLHGYGEAPPVAVELTPAEPPAGNFLVDFDRLPGGDNPLGDLMGLAACGLNFRSIAGEPPRLATYNGNQALSSGTCTYPTGFNIVIDFARPVYGVSANVNSCSTCNVTVIARAADGTELARAQTPSGPYFQFTAAAGVRSTNPIGTVEFWPSKNNAGVSVDNCYLQVTPLRADFDGDGQVNVQDLEHFVACHTGPGIEQTARECLDTRLDDDEDVDQTDFGILQRCLGIESSLEPACPN